MGIKLGDSDAVIGCQVYNFTQALTVDSKSAMGVKPGDSDAVIGYQVENGTQTWSVEHFVV